MKQIIVTYTYHLKDDELVHVIDKNLEGMQEDGWHAISIAQSVYPTRKTDANGEKFDFNELAVSVLFEKNE